MKRKWSGIKTKKDNSYPYRLEQYRPGQYGSVKNKRLLVVVHGYSSHRYNMHWLMEILADQLYGDYVIYQYSFETNLLSRNLLSLELVSRELGSEIRRVIREDNVNASGAAFVGHSTGGLVVRRTFLDNLNLFTSVRFVFLGTPHFGSEIADMKNKLVFMDKQTQELALASDFVWRLNRDWKKIESHHVDRALSVVGTRSARVLGMGLPKGDWVQSDGVVRSTSAALTFPHSKCFVLFIPHNHEQLRKIPDSWRRLGSLRKKAVRSIPEVTNDLSTVAAIQFLRDHQLNSHSELWEHCVNMFETLEKDYRTTLVNEKHGWVECASGGWMPGDRQNPNLVGVFDDEPYIEPITNREEFIPDSPPDRPEFAKTFEQYIQSLKEFWSFGTTGSLALRLDYIDTPPSPRIARIVDRETNAEIDVPEGTFLRCGERWVTLWIPAIDTGIYMIYLEHEDQYYEVETEIRSHFLTALEVDASTKEIFNICGDLAYLGDSVSEGISELNAELNRSTWDITGELPRVIVVMNDPEEDPDIAGE